MNIEIPMIAMTHCEAAKVHDKFPAASEGFLCSTQWAETLSYKDGLFGTASEYDKLFKDTFEG
jgi:branched-chain amino acid transport system substrate-binding protein